jgi:TonB family protein
MMWMLAGIMLQAAAQLPALPAPPAPPPPPPAKGKARARANLAALLSNDDYPVEALRNGVEGVVTFRLQVGADGRVTGCTITRSSGSPILDSTTCRLLSARARFSPARNRKGRPVPDSVAARIVWRIGGPSLPPLAAMVRVSTMRATAEGETSCLDGTGAAPPEARPCPAEPAARLGATARRAGRPAEQTVLAIITPAGEAEPALPADPGTLLFETESALSIAADGSVAECRQTRSVTHGFAAAGPPPPDNCEGAFKPGAKMFRALAPGSAPRAVTIKMRGYVRF